MSWAVRAVKPSLPGGSFIDPARKKRRNDTSGFSLGKMSRFAGTLEADLGGGGEGMRAGHEQEPSQRYATKAARFMAGPLSLPAPSPATAEAAA